MPKPAQIKTKKIAGLSRLLAATVAVGFCGVIFMTATQAGLTTTSSGKRAYTSERTGLQAFAGGNSINVRWNLAGAKATNTVEGYRVYRNGKRVATTKPGSTVNYVDREGTRYNDTKIKPGTTYSYQVAPVYADGTLGKRSKKVTIRAPLQTTPLPTITVDASGAKDLEQWAKTVIVPELKIWYPKISDAIAYPDYSPPKKFTIKFSKDGLAVTSGTTITLSAKHFREHKDDAGTVVHEAAHVIQGFSGESKIPTWLMEGMADYARNVIYADKPVVASTSDYYTDGYQDTAAFLDWIERNYEKGYVRRVNIMGHKRATSDSKLKFKNGKSFDDAWADMLDVPVRSGKGKDNDD